MKIIKDPRVNDWKMQITCLNCTAQLEVEETDIQVKYYPGSGDQRDYTPAYYSYTTLCMVCDTLIGIKKDLLPKIIQVQLQKKADRSQPSSYWG